MPIVKPDKKKKVKRTPEQEAQLAAGSEFIRRREKLAAQQNILSREVGRALVPEEQVATEREVAGRKAQEFLGEQDFFQETRPSEFEFNVPKRTGVEALPIVGPSIAALKQEVPPPGEFPGLFNPIGNILQEGMRAGIIDIPEQATPLLNDPETVRELAQRAIQQDVINEGLSAGEKFGAATEAIPFLGPLVSKYASGLIETPGANARTIVEEITAMGSRATNMREKALTGKMGDPYEAFRQIVDMENKMAARKQRLQLLLVNSAILQADADTINKMEEAILDADQRIFDAKQSAASGLSAIPSDASLFSELQVLVERGS